MTSTFHQKTTKPVWCWLGFQNLSPSNHCALQSLFQSFNFSQISDALNHFVLSKPKLISHFEFNSMVMSCTLEHILVYLIVLLYFVIIKILETYCTNFILIQQFSFIMAAKHLENVVIWLQAVSTASKTLAGNNTSLLLNVTLRSQFSFMATYFGLKSVIILWEKY